MWRRAHLIVFSLLAVTLASCDSSTDLDSVSLVGIWNGVGAMQLEDNSYGISLYVQSDANGTLSGTWSGARGSGTLVNGSVQDGQVTFRLSGFSGPDPTFQGRLTNQHRLAGELNGFELPGDAVFRRRSVAVDD